jgi:hypothetical protein
MMERSADPAVRGWSRWKLDRLLLGFEFSTLSQVYGEAGRSAAVSAYCIINRAQ